MLQPKKEDGCNPRLVRISAPHRWAGWRSEAGAPCTWHWTLDGTTLRREHCAGRQDHCVYTSPTIRYAGFYFYARPSPELIGTVLKHLQPATHRLGRLCRSKDIHRHRLIQKRHYEQLPQKVAATVNAEAEQLHVTLWPETVVHGLWHRMAAREYKNIWPLLAVHRSLIKFVALWCHWTLRQTNDCCIATTLCKY